MSHFKLPLLLALTFGGGYEAHSTVSPNGTAPSTGLPQVAATPPATPPSAPAARVAKAYGAYGVTFLEKKQQYEELKASIRENEGKQFTDTRNALNTLERAISDQDEAVEAATTTDEIDAAINALKDAFKTFITSVTLDGDTFDLTCLMVNPTPTSYGNGWTIKGSHEFDESNNVAQLRFNTTASISQVLDDLPVGNYSLDVQAVTLAGESKVEAAGKEATIDYPVRKLSNLSQAASYFDGGYGHEYLDFTNVESQDVAISLTAKIKDYDQWLVWRSFKLDYLGKPSTYDYGNLLYDIYDNFRQKIDEAQLPDNIKNAFEEVYSSSYYDELLNRFTYNDRYVNRVIQGIKDISNNISSLQAMEASWAGFLEFCEQVKGLEYVSTGDEAKATLDALIEEKGTAEGFSDYSGTDAEAFEAVLATSRETLRTAAITYVTTAELSSIWSFYDLTFLINTPTPTSSVEGWTVSDPDALAYDDFFQVASFKDAAGASISQTLSQELPAGDYVLIAHASTGEGMSATLSANDKSVSVYQVYGLEVTSDLWPDTLGFNLDTPQAVTISLAADSAIGDHLLVWRDFQLLYYGKNELKPYKDAYTAALDDAERVAASLYYEGSEERQSLSEVIDEDPGTTAESLQAITERLVSATAVARAALPAFKNLDIEIQNAYAFEDLDLYDYEGALYWGDRTITADEAVALCHELKVKESEAFNGTYTTDLSYLLNDWNSGRADDNAALFNAGGQHWSGDAGHGYWDVSLDKYEDGPFGRSYYNFMSKNITLPAGKYGIKFAGRATKGSEMFPRAEVFSPSGYGATGQLLCNGYTGKGIDTEGSPNYGDGSFVNDGDGYGWEWSYVLFTLEEPGEMTIEFAASAFEADQRMGFADLSLFAATESTDDLLELQEEATEEPAAGIFKTVAYGGRALYGGWNSIVLPFEATLDEVGATAAYSFEGTTLIDGDAYRVDLKALGEGENLKANTPYIIRMAADKTDGLTFPAKAVVPSGKHPQSAESNGFTMVGTYVAHAKGSDATDFIEQGDYIVGHEGFVKARGGNRINAFRAYLDNAFPTINEAKGVAIDGEEVTGIDAVAIGSALTGKAYNLQGQQVEHPRHGVFIIDGRKVVVR